MKIEGAKAFRRRLGVRVRALRKAAGLTQEELGEKAGLSYKYIGELERGQVNVSLDSIVRIADAVGVKAAGLLDDEEHAVKSSCGKEHPPKFTHQDLKLIKKAVNTIGRIVSKIKP